MFYKDLKMRTKLLITLLPLLIIFISFFILFYFLNVSGVVKDYAIKEVGNISEKYAFEIKNKMDSYHT